LHRGIPVSPTGIVRSSARDEKLNERKLNAPRGSGCMIRMAHLGRNFFNHK
jgi:hypothetical protein